MASRFATVSKDEILAKNEAAAPTNTAKKETKFGFFCVYWSVEKTFLKVMLHGTIRKDNF